MVDPHGSGEAEVGGEGERRGALVESDLTGGGGLIMGHGEG